MKKIKYLILIILCLIVGNIDVFANSTSGANKSDIESKLNKKNGVIIGDNNFVCFYKLKTGDNYIAIKFVKGSDGFSITNITHNFAPMFSNNPTIIVDGKQYNEFLINGTKESIMSFCESRILKYDSTYNMMYIEKSENSYNLPGNEYNYDKNMYTIQQSEEDTNEVKGEPCTKSTFGTAYLTYNDKEGWYLLNDKGEKICLANPKNGTNDFTLDTHITDKNFDASFSCEKYNVAKNVQGTYSCNYFLYESIYQDNVTDNVNIEGNKKIDIDLVGDEKYKTCEELFGSELLKWLKEAFIALMIAVVMLLIILTSFDFAKVVFSDDKEGMPNAVKRFIRRVIAAVLIILTPSIILIIADLTTASQIKSCVQTINEWTETGDS